MSSTQKMTERRSSVPMPDEYRAEFKKIGDAIGGCKESIRDEVGKAEKGYKILSSGISAVEGKVDQAISNGDKRLKGHDERLDLHDQAFVDHAAEIEKLKKNEKDNRAEIRKLREGLDGVIHSVSQIDHVARTTNSVVSSLQITQGDGFNAMGRQFATVGDSINQLRKDLAAKPKLISWHSKIPIPAYGVITVAVLGVAIYYFTGDQTIVNLFKRGG